MTDQGPDHAELRRRAFSRDGTEEDRRRLAEFEAAASRPPESEAVAATPVDALVDVVDVVDVDATEADDAASHPDRPSVTPRLAALLCAGALLLGIAGTVTVDVALEAQAPPTTGLTSPPTSIEPRDYESLVWILGDDSLAIFDEPATEDDTPPTDAFSRLLNGATDIQVRHLATSGVLEIYGATGVRNGLAQVCLMTRLPETGSASCTTMGDFQLAGIRHVDAGMTIRWGPDGSPYMLGTLSNP